MGLWAQLLAQLRSAHGQPEQAGAPVGAIDAPFDETFGLHLINKLAGTGAVDAKPGRETALVDVWLIEEIAQGSVLQWRQPSFNSHIGEDGSTNLSKTARQRRCYSLDWHTALEDYEIVGAITIKVSIPDHL